MVQGYCTRIDVKSMSIVFSIFYKRFVVQNIFERNQKGLLSFGGFAAMVQGSCKRIDVKSMSIIFSIFYKRFVVQNIFERKVKGSIYLQCNKAAAGSRNI